jgi:hypothetical protein
LQIQVFRQITHKQIFKASVVRTFWINLHLIVLGKYYRAKVQKKFVTIHSD